MKIISNFALLDVKHGRKQLRKICDNAKGNVRILVTINGFITGRWGGDDGTSIEFSVEVTKVKVSQ